MLKKEKKVEQKCTKMTTVLGTACFQKEAATIWDRKISPSARNGGICLRGDSMRGPWEEGSFTADPERYVK